MGLVKMSTTGKTKRNNTKENIKYLHLNFGR